MERNVGENYENGEVTGLTVDELNDGTESAYFKRVHTAYWVDDDPFLICTRCEAEINKNNSLGAKNHTNYCPCCGSYMKGRLSNDSK